MTLQCAKCNSAVSAGDQFCGACGQPLLPDGGIPRSTESEVAGPKAAGYWPKLGLVAGASLLLLGVGTYLMSASTEYTSSDFAPSTPPVSVDSNQAATQRPAVPAAPQPEVRPEKEARVTDGAASPGAQPAAPPDLPSDHPLNEIFKNLPTTESQKDARATDDAAQGTGQQESMPPLVIPGLPADHPLNELFGQLQESGKRQQDARDAQPETPAPGVQSTGQGGRLGVKIQDVDADMAAALGLDKVEGAMVSQVDAAGPAAGKLQVGDAILEIGGQTVQNAASVRERVSAHAPGTSVLFRVLRNGDRIMIAIRLGGA